MSRAAGAGEWDDSLGGLPPPGVMPGEEGITEEGRGLVLQVKPAADPQFWKDCPISPGCIIEFPTRRNGESGEETSAIALYVEGISRDDTGFWLTVKFLGAEDRWS